MNKVFLLGMVFLLGLASCSDDDDALPAGERPDERLSEALSNYKSQLVNAEYGWKAVLYPGAGAAYTFLFVFSENDRVSMYSDIDATTASVPMESTYRLKAMQLPTLLFDTYSYLHILSDPDPSKSNGVTGSGKFSDFSFSFDTLTDGSMELVGLYHGSRLVLEEATQEEAENLMPDISENVTAFENIDNFKTYFKRLTVGGNEYDLTVNTNYRQIGFSYFEGNTLKSFVSDYFYTREGLELINPFVIGSTSISALNIVAYDPQNSSISVSMGGGAGNIRPASEPIAIDTQAANRFYNGSPNGAYWMTNNGFTIEGDPDALGVAAIADFYFSVFWPQFGKEEGVVYDLFGFVVDTPEGVFIYGGPAFVLELSNDGRLIFNYFGILGDIAPEDEAVLVATTEIFTNPEGFFVIQTGPQSYDLVSADGATKWISFF